MLVLTYICAQFKDLRWQFLVPKQLMFSDDIMTTFSNNKTSVLVEKIGKFLLKMSEERKNADKWGLETLSNEIRVELFGV